MADDTPEAGAPRPERPSASVPQGRWQRGWQLGRAVGGVAASAAAEGLGRLLRGQPAPWAELLLSSGNAQQLAQRLSQLRGAVMKAGQLMSMDGHGLLPPAFAQALAGLREQAHTLPADQLAQVLETAYGPQWHQRFARFSFAPVAAASIGQVHRAVTHEGQVLALKIQYPGVRDSIDGDMANLALLARLPGLLPAGFDAAPLLAQVRAQLLLETDYAAEAAAARSYRAALGDEPLLAVPEVVDAHCSDQILALQFMPGIPVDQLAAEAHPQALRNQVATALCRLTAHELFGMRLVQTDPNFGNYLVDPATGRTALLDFGATRPVSPEVVQGLRQVLRAMQAGDRAALAAAAQALGLTDPADAPGQTAGVLDLLAAAAEPLHAPGLYDFGQSDLLARLAVQGQALWRSEGPGRPPPAELLLLQRKVIGMVLLCARLKAQLDLTALLAPYS